MTKRETTTVIVVNAFEGNHKKADFTRWLAKQLGPRGVALICEAQHNLPALRQEFGPGHVYPATVRPETHSGDVAVVLTGGKADSVKSVQLCREAPSRFAHDRWLTEVTRGNNVAIAGHGQALIQRGHDGDWADNPGAVGWATRGVPRMRERLAHHVDLGRDVIFGTDGNADERGPKDGPSPRNVFEAVGMEHLNHGLMWFAWTPEHYDVLDWDVLPTPPGADRHKVLKVRLASKEKL